MISKLKSIESYLKALTCRADLEILSQVLKEADFSYEDVKSLCKFDDQHYSRNLISTGKWFDMLLLCWKPGQESAIHDHPGSSCAFRIVKGTSTEDQYELTGESRKGVQLVRACKRVFYRVGELCLAEDNAIHKISNISKTEDLVTLHIYSPPLHMNYYDTEAGETGYKPPDASQRVPA